MDKNLFHLLELKNEETELLLIDQCNEESSKFGLTLSKEDAHELILCRNDSLKKYQRVEFGSGILDKIIYTFEDSQFIHQDNYLETLIWLLDIFYQFKNESCDKLTDDELLSFMKDSFETICFGDLEYLESTCLDRFASAIRGGYHGYERSDEHGNYEHFSEETRWSKELYFDALHDLF